MGQPVAVVAKPSNTPGILRLEANRNLTGMGHERFRSPAEAIGPRPSAVLARRLFETGKVDAVHVYLNMVTVDLSRGHTPEGLDEILENLYIYYTPGFVPPPLVMPEEPAAAAPAADGGDSAAAGSGLDPRVPAHLWERSQKGKATWYAKQAGG